MTREEAVEFLIVTQNISPEHMMELLGALSPQVCDDCVSREAVMDAITAEYNRKSTGDGLRLAWIEKAVNSVPSVSPQPCGDAISRDELLKAMDTWDKFGYTETGCFVREPKNDYIKYIHYDDVIKCIKGMPSVSLQQKVGKWIPVNERLPEKGGDYLVTQKATFTDYVYISVAGYALNLHDVDEYDFADKKRPGWYEYDPEWGYCEFDDVIAWMPLPEPYKAESEDKE